MMTQDEVIKFEQTKVLISIVPSSIISSFVAALLLVLFVYDVADPMVLQWWAGSIAVLTIVRYSFVLYFRGRIDNPVMYNLYVNIFFVSIVILGTIWGLGAVYLIADVDSIYRYIILFFLFATCAGAAGLYGVKLFAAYCFIMPALLPSIAYNFYLGGANLSVAYAGIIFMIVVYISTRQIQRYVTRSIILNKMLSDEVEERKKTEQQLAMSKAFAEATTDAKSAFLANMSHEIRTPLNAIINLSKHLSEKPLPADALQHLKVITNSGDHLLTVINDVLDISKIESQEFQLQESHFNLYACFKSTINTLNMMASEKLLALSLDYQGNFEQVAFADESRLRQVLFNLINNAIKFTEAGQVQVKVKLVNKSGYFQLYVEVIDTGIGIEPQSLKQLFNNFQQLDNGRSRKYEGSGLGLSISKKLVELMGGKIQVTSEIGVGSNFSFDMPFVYGEAEQLVREPESLLTEQLELQIKFLVVDDNVTNLEVMRIFFAERGFDISTALNGEEAIELLKQHDFDMLLIDLEMPVMDGLSATKAIREGEAGNKNQDIPIIIHSAYSSKQQMDDSLLIGANAYVSKPIDFNELFKVINQLHKLGATSDNLVVENPLTERQAKFRKLFLIEVPVIEKALQKAIDNQDFQAIKNLAHKHKSSTGMLGFEVLYRLFTELEKLVEEDNFPVLMTKYKEIKNELNRVC